MLALNGAFVLLLVALAWRDLPWNEWLSATAVAFALGLIAVGAELSAVTIILEGEMTAGHRLFWIVFVLGSLVCAKGLVRDALRTARSAAAR